MPVIYLVRHGQASFGAAQYDQLSELGYRQGARLGESLRRNRFVPAAVVCGTLQRHTQTAEACLQAMEHSPYWQEDAGLDEFDYMDILQQHNPALISHHALVEHLQAEADPRAAFETLFQAALEQWMRDDGDYRESWAEFRERVLDVARRLAAVLQSGEHLLVFTSGGPVAVLAQALLEFPDQRWPAFSRGLVNAGLTRVVGRPGHFRLASINEHLHLGDELLSYR